MMTSRTPFDACGFVAAATVAGFLALASWPAHARTMTCVVPIEGQEILHPKGPDGQPVGYIGGNALLDGRHFFWGDAGYYLLSVKTRRLQRVQMPAGVPNDGRGNFQELPDRRVLLSTSVGWFLMQEGDDRFEQIEKIGTTGLPRNMLASSSPNERIPSLSDASALIWAEKGWFLLAHGAKALEFIAAPSITGSPLMIRALSDGGAVLLTTRGLFRLSRSPLRLEAIKGAERTEQFVQIRALANGGAMIESMRAWFVLHANRLEEVGTTALTGDAVSPYRPNPTTFYPAPQDPLLRGGFQIDASGRALIFAKKGLFTLDADEKRLIGIRAAGELGEIRSFAPLEDGSSIVLTRVGMWLLTNGASQLLRIMVFQRPGEHPTVAAREIELSIHPPDYGPREKGDPETTTISTIQHMALASSARASLIDIGSNVYLLQRGSTFLKNVETPQGSFSDVSMASLPNGAMYLWDTERLFALDVERARLERLLTLPDSDFVRKIVPTADGRVLVWSQNGLRMLTDDRKHVETVALRDTDMDISDVEQGDAGSTLIWLAPKSGRPFRVFDDWAFALVTADLSAATARFDTADVAATDHRTLIPVSVASECTDGLRYWNPVLKVAGGGTRSPEGDTLTPIQISPPELKFEYAFTKPGKYKLELWLSDPATRVGEGATIAARATPSNDMQSLVAAASTILGVGLVVANMSLFAAARRSPWALRLAVDGSLGGAALRVVTVALTHFAWAQVWIFDLYFQRRKTLMRAAPPFLFLPLSADDGSLKEGKDVVMRSWKSRRIWIRGNSGMGKTALFNHVTSAHFHDSASSIDAFARTGYLIVAFSARDFVTAGEDQLDSTWVVDAVKATLSQTGVTFEDEKLLRRILQAGTLAIAIDGVHEAGRARAVEAFAHEFERTPLFVTSQERGPASFENWSLPADMSAFVADLIRLHYAPADAEILLGRIHASGLYAAIQSGYDVRLLLDLAADDPGGATLPADRLSLYSAVVEAAWPSGSAERRQEQQSRMIAAAWRMVSERKPNEYKRRLDLKTDALLSEDLLAALADAPARESKPVRLIQRVNGGYEFVHDQMHEYLAACYFARSGFGVEKMIKLITSSTVWDHAERARRPLWTFAAALLDEEHLLALWARVEEPPEWDTLRRELKRAAEQRGLTASRTP